jgi:hypothetical protein
MAGSRRCSRSAFEREHIQHRSIHGQDVHLDRVDLCLDGRERTVNVLAPAHVALDRREAAALAAGQRLGLGLPCGFALVGDRLELGRTAGEQQQVGSGLWGAESRDGSVKKSDQPSGSAGRDGGRAGARSRLTLAKSRAVALPMPGEDGGHG